MSSDSLPPLTAEQVEQILAKHVVGGTLTVFKLEEIKDYGYSTTAGFKIYLADLRSGDDPTGPATSSCFLTISQSSSSKDTTGKLTSNTLSTVSSLLTLIRSKTGIPISDSILDTTHTILPSADYLLSPPTPFPSSSIMTLREAKARPGVLSREQRAMVDLQVGRMLGQLHANVQNDWYGLPNASVPASSSSSPSTGTGESEPVEPVSYSWQETFTSLFESLLSHLQTQHSQSPILADFPFTDISSAMSRAIAFSLFDDVDVPSLTWFTGSDADIYVSLPTSTSTKTPGIVAILPSMAHMLWGDPLLESFFMRLGPRGHFASGDPKDDEDEEDDTKALLEGYFGSAGSPTLISFPRQKTKRVWYTLFLALTLLSEYLDIEASEEKVEELEAVARKKRIEWAEETIRRCTEILKTAPCY